MKINNPRTKTAFTTPLLANPCPFCGDKHPQLQEYSYGRGMVVRCPQCWAITKVKFTWLAAVDDWQGGKFSKETVMLNNKTTMNMDGAFRLAEAVLEDAGNEYKWYLIRAKTSKSEKEKAKWKYEADRMEKMFFKGNSIIKALPIDGDEVVKTLQKQVEKEMK